MNAIRPRAALGYRRWPDPASSDSRSKRYCPARSEPGSGLTSTVRNGDL